MPELTFTQVQDARIFAESIVNTVREPLLVLDGHLHVVSANDSFYQTFRVSGQETVGQLVYRLGNGQWDIPKLRELLETIIPQNTEFQGFEVEHTFPGIGHKIMLLNARRIHQEGERRELILLVIDDVTDRITARRALEDAEAKYHKFVENINSIIMGFDAAGKITFFNHFAEKLFGYAREEVQGRELVGTIIPRVESSGKDNSGLVAGVIERPEEHYINESEGVKKDGGRLLFSWSAKTVRDRRGAVAEVLIDGNDLTPRREQTAATEKAEVALRSERELLQAVVDGIPVMLTIYDPAMQSFRVNRYFTQVTGWTEEDARQDLAAKVYPDPEKREEVLRFMQSLAPGWLDLTMTAKDGSKIATSWSNIKLPGGRRVGVGLDIRERKKTEEALRDSRERYARLFNAKIYGVAHCRTITDGQGRPVNYEILQVNDTYLRIIGVRREDIEGRLVTDVFPGIENMPAGYIRKYGKIALEGGEVMFEDFFPATNQWLEIYAYQPRRGEFTAIFTDITERKKADEALRVSQRRYDALFNTKSNGIVHWKVVTDAGGKPADLKCLQVNSAFEKIIGKKKGQVEGRLLTEIFPGIQNAPQDYIGKYGNIALHGGELVWEDYFEPTGTWVSDYVFSPLPGEVTVFFTDITERKKAEEALRRSDEIIRSVNSIIMTIDRRGGITFINDFGLRFFGYSREELIGRNVVGTIVPETESTGRDLELMVSHIIADPLKYQTNPNENMKKNGERVWISWSNKAIEDSGGNLAGVFTVGNDITRQKKTEDELRVRHEQFESFFENAPGILNLEDEDFCYINTDRITPTYFGLTRESIRGKCVGDLAPEFVRDFGGMLRRVIDTGEPSINAEVQSPVTGRGGEVTYWRASYFRVPLGDGKWGLGVVGVDITDLKKAEDVLRRNEYELRTLVDNSPDIIFRLNRPLQYVYVNPAYERITGLAREQFIGRTNEELGMPRQMGEFWRSQALGVFENGREGSAEFEMSSFFGKRYFSARLIPEFDRTGLVDTVLVIARDITERRRAEEQIRYISFHDQVTGLYNRAFFEEEIRRVDTERDLPISIIMGDVNNLKLTNDVFGHDEGDKLLRAIADSIRSACRQSDIVARWGGDEFAVILPKTDFVTADGICARIGEITREYRGTVLPPSVAVGIAAKERRDQNIYQVIRQAEQYMYDFKLDHAEENKQSMLSALLDRVREKAADYAAHVGRSYELACRFGDELGLPEEQQRDLRLLVELHDIGDAVVPAEVLAKPGRLNVEEWDTMKKHAEAGFRIVKTYGDTARISDEVLSHGERWDGSGYPRGLKGAEIPYLARVFAVIDAFDAMTHPRPYARTLTRDEAVEELRRNAGRQFDPELAERFIRVVLQEAAAPKEHV